MSEIKKEAFSLSELYPAMQSVIASGGEFLFYPNGKSMLPTICPERDGVLLARAEKLRTGDLLLFVRRDGSFVLHRLVKMEKNGSLVLRGDAQYIDERGILPNAVIGRVSAIIRGKKEIRTDSLSFRARSQMLRISYPLRRFLHRAKGKIARTLKGKR